MRNIVAVAISAYQVYLVFHQGYERRYDDGHALAEQCGQLVAERFAASCRHDDKCISAVEDTPDDLFLLTLEGVKTEIFM